MRIHIKGALTIDGHYTALEFPLRKALMTTPSKAELLYARHKLRSGKCHFRSARKREFNEKLNDGN